MPTTRRQTAIAEGRIKPTEKVKAKKRYSTSQKKVGKKDIAENDVKEDTQQRYNLDDGPASKKLKMDESEETKSVYYKVGECRNIDWCACC